MQSTKNPEVKGDKKAWECLNHNLSIDRTVSEKIKGHADMPRHGHPYSMSDDDRCEVFRLTDETIRRSPRIHSAGFRTFATE